MLNQKQLSRFQFIRRNAAILAAVAAALGASSAIAGTTAGEVTISVSGSTALKNYITTGGFTYLEPGSSITLQNGPYAGSGTTTISPAWQTYNADGSANTSTGVVTSFQLAPSNLTTTLTGASEQQPAVRLEYHESGSVEGILELANDQIGPINYVQSNIDRNPNGGNAVWVNGNQFGGSKPANVIGTPLNGYYLGPVYGANTSSGYTTYGAGVEPTFNQSGGNTSSVAGSSYSQAGQNAVQLAVTDVIPQQAFTNQTAATDSNASTPWLRTPNDRNYGTGNTVLPTAAYTAKGNNPLQSASVLNMAATAINPRTNAAFGTGPWNTGGLNNLDSSRLAVTATFIDANPGTGLDRLDRADAQWLQTTGRLANGAVFNMVTRDVNSGTRNVVALNSGIDPSWAVGANDNGNGNLPSTGITGQISIGSAFRFSNKTSGGAQLRPTLQNSRMGVGTLSAGDSYGSVGDLVTNQNNQAYSLRALEYSDSSAGTSNYVLPSATNIVDGNYVIYQNEQLVTLKAPSAANASDTQAAWASVNTSAGAAVTGSTTPVQGDDASGDVANLEANALNSITNFTNATQQGQQLINTLGNSSFALITKGFILPQFMQVEKTMDGIGQSSSNSSYNSAFSADFLSNFSAYTTPGNPDNQVGNATDVYGGEGTNTASFNTKIPITSFSNSHGSTAGGNWLFGNFNQNGVRDFDSVVVTGEQALAALESSAAGTSSFNGSSNSTAITGLPSTLATMNSGSPATKGDLIAMGDYDGRGVFDGKSLYELAIGASIADPTANPSVSGSGSTATITGNDHLTLKSETLTVTNYDGTTSNVTTQTFGDAVRSGQLFKNTALDYLNQVASAQMKTEAAAVLSGFTVPAGATDLHSSDAISGAEQFTYDPSGTNAFNKSDVNQDGVVDFNDALVVDNSYGISYSNQSNSLTVTEPTPLTGVSELTNLVLAQQIDGEAKISQNDLNIINTQLTGSGTTNWYSYAANKSGPGLITFNRSSSVVNLYSGASLNISSGTIQILSTLDPFTANNSSTGVPASLADTSHSLAVSVTTGGKLQYSGSNNAATGGIVEERLSSLNVSGGSVVIDPAANHADRTVLVTGSLNVSGGKIDLGNGDLIAQGGRLAGITSLIKSGYNSGAWNGSGGITSSSAASDHNHLTALGVIQSTGTGAYASFDGVPSTAGDVLVKTTYYGDANLDGKVDGSDYSKIDAGFLSGTASGWANGDFNYDGVINGSDYTLIDNAFNTQGASLAAQLVDPTVQIAAEIAPLAGATSAVPEPTMLGLLGIAAMGLLGRRRRQN